MKDFETVSLTEWYNGLSNDQRLPIVDIRETRNNGALVADNDIDVVVVHLPLSTLLSGERSCELPPRHVSFAVLTDETNLEAAQTFFGATTSNATQQSRKPWLVPQVLISNDKLWEQAIKLGILLKEKEKSMEDIPFQPQSRLWQPDPMVKSVLWPVLRKQSFSPLTLPHSIEVWDLGSGAGRDVCFLAEQAKSSDMDCYKFVGIDNHKGSVKRCLPFWKHRQVEEYTEARNIHLNKVNLVQDELKKRNVACLFAVRFWNAKLVSCIANDDNIVTGTLFAVSHFCKPYPGAPWDFDHPKEKSVLERNELKALFENTKRWQVLHDELAEDGDHGRTLIQFVAKRS